jgi:hypothetical protein
MVPLTLGRRNLFLLHIILYEYRTERYLKKIVQFSSVQVPESYSRNPPATNNKKVFPLLLKAKVLPVVIYTAFTSLQTLHLRPVTKVLLLLQDTLYICKCVL